MAEPDVVSLHEDVAKDSSNALHGLDTKSIDAILAATFPEVKAGLEGKQGGSVELEREGGELSHLGSGHGEAIVVEERIIVRDTADADQVSGRAHGQEGGLDLRIDDGVQQ